MRWTLTKKVLLFSLAFLLLLVVFGMVAVDNIRKNAAVTNYLTGYIMQRAALSQDFDIAVARAIAEAQAFTFTYDPKDREEAVAAIAQAQAYVAELAVLHNQNDYGGAPTRAQNIQFHQRREALLLNAEEKVLAALRATDANNTAAAERARTALEAFEDEFEQLEQDAAAMIGRQVDTTVSTLQTRNAAGLQRTPAAFVLLAVAVVMLVMRLRRAVVQPINALSAAASTVAHGDLSPTVPVTSNDEIGALQHAFNHMVHSLRDQAAAQQQAEAELQHLALYDQLTHLPNRALFNDRLQHALMSLQRHHEHVAVLFLDLDNFKVVNDSLGHTSGDRLLTIVTERLCVAVRPNDTVARFGGDEFTVLLDHVGSACEAIAVAQRLLQQVQAPVLLDGHEVRPQASIGIALSTPQTRGADDLLRDADTALGRAKQNGKAQYQIFDPSMNVQAMERLQLEAELRHGLERGEFVLHYQPIVALHSGEIVGTEALVRWRHPQRGMVPPNMFIPLAEETGLILGLGEWVLRTACQQMREWQTQFAHAPQFVSVNISARQFADPSLTAMVAQALCDHDLPGAALELELTESIVMESGAATHDVLHALKTLGVHLAIDDFGTGYSSLSYLKRLPVDVLKVDKSFVDGLGSDTEDTAIVRAIVSLAHTLNLAVTGEGIETAAQCHDLEALGCNHGQGYYFSKPQPGDAITTLLAAAPAHDDAPVPVA